VRIELFMVVTFMATALERTASLRPAMVAPIVTVTMPIAIIISTSEYPASADRLTPSARM
jgi:hypothetical protein